MRNIRDIKAFIRESGRYMLAGCLTASVNLVTFYTLSEGFSVNYLISNGIAWLFTVIVGFILDKKYVFRSAHSGRRELLQFAGGRLLSLAADQLMIWMLVDIAGLKSAVAKIVDSAVVVVINYIVSRRIFKKPKKKGDGK